MTSRLPSRTVLLLSCIGLSAFAAVGCGSPQPADVPLSAPPVPPEPKVVLATDEVDALVVQLDPAAPFDEVERLTVDTEKLVPNTAPATPPAPVVTPAVIVVDPAEPVAPAVVTGEKVDPAKAAAAIAGRLSKVGLAERFGADHARLIVQVNRAVNSSSVTANRSEILRDMESALRSRNVALTSETSGRLQVARPKAIHLAFGDESRFLGILPSKDVSNAPEVIVNTRIVDETDGVVLSVEALDTRDGKVFYKESVAL